MSPTTNLFLTHPQFFALGGQIGGARSKLSPLGKSAARERVLNPELVTGAGQLRLELAPVFRVLASAQSFCVVGYAGRLTSYEMASYYPGLVASPEGVSLIYLGDGLQIQSPPAGGDALELLRQYLGETLLKRVELEADMPILEAWLLFGAVDAFRRKHLAHLLKENDGLAEAVSAAEIAAGLESKTPGLEWLAPYFDACLRLATPARAEIEAGLGGLVAKGLLILSGANYLPGEVVQQLAAEFLLVEGHLRLRAAALNPAGEAISADLRAIQGLAGSLLFWSHDAAGINLWGASPAQALTLIGSLLQNPGPALLPGVTPVQRRVPPPPERL